MGIWYCTLFAISHPKILYYPFRNLWFLLFSSLLVPCGIFDSFLLLESIWGALILPVEVLDSARTMQRHAEHFTNQEQCGNCTRILLCNDRLHATINSIVMQDLSMALLTPYVLIQPHSSMVEQSF